MAENQEDREGGDLSEEESPYRVEELRRQGKVAQSREVAALLSLLACGVTTLLFFKSQSADFLGFFKTSLVIDSKTLVTGEILMFFFKKCAFYLLPVCVIGFLFAALGSLIQIGFVFSTDPLTPNFEKLNPMEGLQKFFSVKILVETLRVLVRLLIVFSVVYFLLKKDMLASTKRIFIDPHTLFLELEAIGTRGFFSFFGVMMLFAGLDFWLQKKEYSKQTRLTKQEAKQESKEKDGDPQVKAKIRSIQREVARRRMMDAVKKATVVVTNPTHIAVAILYDKDKMSAPKVIAKGADFLAQQIKKVAAESGVPLVENVPLARAMFKSVKIGKTIPKNLYQAVAEVLAYVYKLRGRQ